MQRELIAEGARSVLYRSHRGDQPVVWKLLRDGRPTSAALSRFNNELHITRDLQIPGIRRALRKVEIDGRHGLELEFLPGAPPERTPVRSPSELARVLEGVAGLCDTLQQLHEVGVVHRDLKPANLIADPQSGTLTLIDFGSASEVQHAAEAGATLEGTVAYISPEQSGRMNRTVDSRSDLYSLGATLFELLAGELPFHGADAAELIHSHIARPAPRLDAVNDRIPARVADIVDRLLRKDPDARYQSAAGVAFDLRRCLELGLEGPLAFPLGEGDQDRTFRVSERLYGRQGAVEQLLAAFEVARMGQPMLVSVRGPSGIGKSKLVREVEPRIVESHGTFVMGKCHQLQRSTPYAGLAAALEQLANLLLLDSDAELVQTSRRIADAVGDLGGVLTSLVPAFEAVLGPQPDVPVLEPNETRDRFEFVLTRFFDAVARPERPLVLFLDDLQWVDFSTLELLEHLIDPGRECALLVVGTFREEEVDAAHPLARSLERIDGASIELGALTVADLVALLADSLQRAPLEVTELARQVYDKTRGNPFFVRTFLGALHRQGALHWQGSWCIDHEAVQRSGVTDNLADLLTSRFHKLPSDAQRLLHLAACVGFRVSLELLGEIAETPAASTARALWPVVRDGYLLPTNRLLGAVGDELSPEDALRFSHDRIRAAAYELVDEDERRRSHLRIGRVLLERGGRVFSITSHLNRARDLLDDDALLVRLNLEAARQASEAAAYAEALEMLEVGLAAGEGTGLPLRELHELAALACYQLGQHARAEALAEQVLAQTRDPLERSRAQRVRLLCALATDDMTRAVDVALEALAELGEPFPARPFGLHIGLALAKTKWLLWGRTPEDLAQAPPMEDRSKLEAMVVLEKAVPAAFRSSSNQFPLFVLRLVQLTLEHGVGPVSSFAYAGYAIMLAGVLGDIEGAYAFGQLSLTLSERMAHAHGAMRSKSLFVWNNMVRHWKEPLHRSIPSLEEAYRHGAEAGSQFEQVWAAFYRIVWMLVVGRELDEVAHEIETYRSVFAKDEAASMHARMLRQVVHNLVEADVEDRRVLAGPYCEEAEIQALVTNTADRTQVVLYRFVAGWLCNHVQGFEQGLAHLELAEAEIEAVVALPFVPLVQLEAGLARCRLRRDLPKVRRAIKALHRAARTAPSNYAHKAFWLEAELALASGRLEEAQQRIQKALKAMRGAGWRQEEARIYDAATRIYLEADAYVLAEAMAERANVTLRAWGAEGLVQQAAISEPEHLPTSAGVTSYTSSGGNLVDLASLMKAAAAITGTLELETLLIQLLRVLAENIGATHGAVILPDEGSWRVAARLAIDGAAEPVNMVLEQADLCAPAVLYAARSGRPLIVDDARVDSRFRRYAEQAGVCSLLVVPTIQGGVTHGVVYFEHRALPEAFTPDRVRFAELLASQAASAMQNARLHQRLALALENEVSLNRAHRRFVPQRFLENLGHDRIDRIALGDSVEKEMSILFSDVRRFTTLVEGMTADESIQFINGYLQHMEPAIHAQGGFVDSYIGDAIMALFEGEADHAVRAAIDMLHGLRRFNALREAAGREPVEMGIGIAYGPVMMGTIGGPNRLKCGVIGDSVNLGARMESLTKRYGVELLVAGRVQERLVAPEAFCLRRVDRVLVKGKTAPVDIWEVFDADPEPLKLAKLQTADQHESAMQAYFEGSLEKAFADLSAISAVLPDDLLTSMLLDRVRSMSDQGVPEGWDGTRVMTEK